MIINVSYRRKETIEKINKLVGKPFSLFSVNRWSGIGSPRLRLISCSTAISQLFRVGNDTKYCNIELRPQGIIIWFKNAQEVTNWVIPYYRLSIFQNGEGFSIHGEGQVIKIIPSYYKQDINPFFRKLLKKRTTYLEQYA